MIFPLDFEKLVTSWAKQAYWAGVHKLHTAWRVPLEQGRVIAVDRTTTSAPDLSEQLAAKTALQKAGNELARRMLPHWIETLKKKCRISEFLQAANV
jgi:hypothetical protein